ncbi:DNA polymerase III subunit gamma/tau [Bacteroidota bacterium]
MVLEAYQEEYLVTARKWRPLQFKDIVGQEHISITLQNAIKSGRIHHAYLFSGPRGVGKTTTARIYARAINCTDPNGSEPCNKCESCESILNGRSLDVIEIDGASNNSVDDIRKLRENAKYPPLSGRYKMYIIDEVHMLSTSAFNALLKTLEEPPPHLLFVFATTEAHKVIPTILSRCQRFDFRRMETDSIVNKIKYIAEQENVAIDEESLIAIAKKADGSMRDAESTFDQVVAFCGTDIKYSGLANALHLVDRDFFFRISSSIKNKDVRDIFALTNDVINRGYDLQECLSGLLEHFRNILTVNVTGLSELIEGSANIREKYKGEAEKFSKADTLRFMNLTATTEQALRYASQPRIRFELALIQMASMDSSIEISELIKELKDLKKKVPIDPSDKSNIAKPVDKTSLANKIKTEPDGNKEEISQKEKRPEYNHVNTISVVKEPAGNGIISKNSVSSTDLESGWDEFKKKYAISKYGLYVLSQLDMINPKFFNGEIVFRCKNDFISDNIKNKSIDLKEHLSQFYKGTVNIKVVVADETLRDISEKIQQSTDTLPDSNKEKKTNTSSKKLKEVAETSDVSPIEQALIEMFGAKQMRVIKEDKA